MNIFESGEDYLETILFLSKKQEHVRSIDVVNARSFSKASISVAMKKLKDQGYINIDDNGFIYLTDEGLEIANKISERHNVIAELFISLGVKKDIAYKDACKIEHDISDETFSAIKNRTKN